MDYYEYSHKLLEITRDFSNTQYQPLVDEATKAYLVGDVKKMDETFNALPTEFTLLETLVEKLKKKSVYANLKKILKGSAVVKEDHIIAISSLLTHCLIEMKRNGEYKLLVDSIYKKLGALVNDK